MTPMEQEHPGRPVRVVIAAPFGEIAGIHERTAEYADELDVCGVVSSDDDLAQETLQLHPDVIVLSESLGIDPADEASRIAAHSPATGLVVLVRDREAAPRGAADVVLRLDASPRELREAIMFAAGRLSGQTAPPAHSRGDGTTPEDAGDDERPGGSAQSSTLSPSARVWPPPWLRISDPSADDAADAEPRGPAPDAPATEPAAVPSVASPPARQPAVWVTPLVGTVNAGKSLTADVPATAAADGPAHPGPSAPVAEAANLAPTPTQAPAEIAAAPTPEPEAEALAEPLRKRVRRPGRSKAETVLVFSGKGGVGKSVVATNVAVALSSRGSKVALIDLNLQYGDLGVLLHLEGHPTSIESLAQQGEQIDRDFLDEVMATGPEEVRVLLAPASPEFADLVTAASLRAILRELSRTYDYIVVDAPAHLEERVLEVMEVADQVLVVTSFNITAVKDAKVTLKLLQSLAIEQERVAVVLNQTHPKVNFLREEIEKSLKVRVLALLPYDPRMDDAIDQGRPMVVTEPRSDFSKQIRVIVDFLTPDDPSGSGTEAGRKSERSGKRRFFGR